MKKTFEILILLSSAAFAQTAKHITSPTEAFGFQPGTDRKLADWNQLTAYYKKLSRESGRIQYVELGKTTEGRPFIAVTISAPENLAHLDHYLEIQRKLADPRITAPEEAKKLVAEGKTILAVTANIHSTEIASSQSASPYLPTNLQQITTHARSPSCITSSSCWCHRRIPTESSWLLIGTKNTLALRTKVRSRLSSGTTIPATTITEIGPRSLRSKRA